LPNLFHNGTRWAGRRTKAGRCAIKRKDEVCTDEARNDGADGQRNTRTDMPILLTYENRRVVF
jgi:hypothetical protein